MNSPQSAQLLGSEQDHLPFQEEVEDDQHARQVSAWKDLPWWKRPSPYWLVFGVLWDAIGYSALLAPKLALYTRLVCHVHRPEYVNDDLALLSHPMNILPSTDLLSPYFSDDSKPVADRPIYVRLPDASYTTPLDRTLNKPDFDQKCATDPVVQATVARLNAVFNTTMGILMCLTTCWWASLSDRHGRRIALLASVLGLFVTEATHVLTAWFMDILPGGYWFPLLGFIFEGLCGGIPTGMATGHAYLADATDSSTRSQFFMLYVGAMYAGAAVGPVLGGLLIRSTGNLLSVFYFSTILHGIYAALILCLFPESLTRARMQGARLRRSLEKAGQAPGNIVVTIFKSILRFFSPLLVLLPERLFDTQIAGPRRDWSLSFLAISYALSMSTKSSNSFIIQYGVAQFHWTPETSSYYVSCASITPAVFSATILPFVIKYLKPSPIQLPSIPDEPLRGPVGHSPSSHATKSARPLPTLRSAVVDLVVARASLVSETMVLFSMAIASTSMLFTLATMASAFSVGFSPAIKSLALDIYSHRPSKTPGEVGRLYGALSLLETLAGIVSPSVYGFVYSATVSVFPQAFFVLCACTTLLALGPLFLVRVPTDDTIPGNGPEGHDRAETSAIVDIVEEERQ